VANATVLLAGASARTDRLGRAFLHKRFVRPGRRFAVARATGYASGRVAIRVVRG
jgi:hypothetical protein